MGLDIYLRREGVALAYDGQSHDIPSVADPEHICNKTYLRSSYNDGGADRVFARLGLPTLSDIFDVDNAPKRSVTVRSKWQQEDVKTETHDEIDCTAPGYLDACLERQQQALAIYDAMPAHLSVTTISPVSCLDGTFKRVTSEDATRRVIEEIGQRDDAAEKTARVPFDWYIRSSGHFYFGQSLEVLAAIEGVDAFGAPCVHLVSRQTDDTIKYYRTTLVIVGEFIAYAKTLDDGYISWSG